MGGKSVGAQFSTAEAMRAARGLDLDNLLNTPDDAPEEAPGGEAGATAPTAEPSKPSKPRPRRPGPPTLIERRERLDDALRSLARPGAAVEYQANTMAVINDGSAFLRFLLFLLKLPLIPLRLVFQAVVWILRPRGTGRLKRRVVVVDRRGNVVVYRM
ncbi:MAG: hypothetical protein WD734_06810 [Dehalococcoidia bacterium]